MLERRVVRLVRQGCQHALDSREQLWAPNRFQTVETGIRLSPNQRKEPMATAVKEDTFTREVLESDTPVIVDFWAEWCGPCHAVEPVLERIVEERAGEVKLVKVNIDEERELADRYGVVSIPTIVLFKDGAQAAVAVGAQPKGMLERSLGLSAE